ncbi:MAG: hypothetical protein GF349_00515 [Candidatus Magasanikbacteria bacterium]|nr:hypothetical protein [Candidatus Magasanikbacteria bacterium]
MSKNIPLHSDKNWLNGFTRYLAATEIIESNNWKEMFQNLDNFFTQSNCPEKIKSNLFKEYRIINYIIIIEQKLCNLCLYCFQKKYFKENEKVKEYVIKKIKRHQRLEEEGARNILEMQIQEEDERIYTPDKLLYLSGFSLGTFIDMIKSQTKNFEEKNDIIKKLTTLNKNRGLFIHNSTTSREDTSKKINETLILAKKISSTLDKFENSLYEN